MKFLKTRFERCSKASPNYPDLLINHHAHLYAQLFLHARTALFRSSCTCTCCSPTVTIIISHDTIYPTATVESGVATTTVIDICFSEQVQARASIKIMSPSGIMIRSLYSSSGTVTNPKPYVWDGTNDSGALVADGIYTVLISATSNEGNGPMTDSSKTITVASSDNSDSSSDVSDATDNSSATTSTNDTATEDTTVSSKRWTGGIFTYTDASYRYRRQQNDILERGRRLYRCGVRRQRQ